MTLLKKLVQITKSFFRLGIEFFILLYHKKFREDMLEFKKIIKMCRMQNIEILVFGSFKYFLWSYIIGISDVNPMKYKDLFFQIAMSRDGNFYFTSYLRVNKGNKTQLIEIIESTSLRIGEEIEIDEFEDEKPLISIPEKFFELQNSVNPKSFQELLNVFALSKTNDDEMIDDCLQTEAQELKIVYQEDLIKYIKSLLNISLKKACLIEKSFIPPNIIVKIYKILGRKKTLFFVSKIYKFWKPYYLKAFPKMVVITEVHYCLEKKLLKNNFEGE